EIDINEGHYPNEVNTNIHNWTDVTTNKQGKPVHPQYSKSFSYGVNAYYSYQLEIPIKTKKVRFSSNHKTRAHIGEFSIYAVNPLGYPTDPMAENPENQVEGTINFTRASDTKITASGTYQENIASYGPQNVADGKEYTRWITQDNGEKWLETELASEQTVGCIQFTNGWSQNGVWTNLFTDFKIEHWDGNMWREVATQSQTDVIDFSKDYHLFGLEWNKDELIFYVDHKEVRREKNEFSLSPSPIWLSLAIISWDGPVTDAIDGTFMEIDYVKAYKKKGE
ncbi:MAG: family 16 glycosylhydrolase, partial [Prevotellaceae bacterium]|nr:family 16 glycosylhydrolase [Prevotellaceae bacterium]